MSTPESISHTMPSVQYDANLSAMQASVLSASRALQDSLLLNPVLNAANTSIEEDQFKHSFNAVNLEPPRIFTTPGMSVGSLSKLVDAAIEKEISALPQPLQAALRQNIAQYESDSRDFEDFFTQAGGREAGYEALIQSHLNALNTGAQAPLVKDGLSELREMIYMYALMDVASIIPPTTAPPPKTIALQPALVGSLRVLETTEKGVIGLINSQAQTGDATGYGQYLNAVMGALHDAIAAMQQIQAADAKVDRQFATALKTLADIALQEGLKAIADKKAAEAAQAAQAAQQQQQSLISLIILIVTVVVSVVSIAVTLGTAAIAASAATAAAVAAEGGAAAGAAATIGGTGLTLGQMVMIGVDVAGIVVSSVDYATNSAISNTLAQGFADFASSLGMSQEALAAVIAGLAILLFIITRGSAKINPFNRALASASESVGAKITEKVGEKTAAQLATVTTKQVTRTVVANLAIPLLAMSGVMSSLATGIANLMYPNDKEAASTAATVLTIMFMLLTLGAVMGGAGALWRGGKTLGGKIVSAVKGSAGQAVAGVGAGMELSVDVAGQGAQAGARGAGGAVGAADAGAVAGADAAAAAAGGAGRAPAGAVAADQAVDAAAQADNAVAAVGDAGGGGGVAGAAGDAAEVVNPAAARAEGDAAAVQGQPPVEPTPGSAVGKAVDASPDLSKAKSPADEVEVAKAELREVDEQIETANMAMKNLKSRLAQATKELEDLKQLDPTNTEAIKDAEAAVKRIEKEMTQLDESLQTLAGQRKIAQENLDLATAKATDFFNSRQAFFQKMINSIQFLGATSEFSLHVYEFFITMQMADLEKLITKYQTESLQKQAEQARVQTIMNKIKADRDTYLALQDSTGELMQQIYQTGNTLLSALQSGGYAIFSR